MDPGGSHLNVLGGSTSATLILIKLDRRALFSGAVFSVGLGHLTLCSLQIAWSV
jgi:hypothetical protein